MTITDDIRDTIRGLQHSVARLHGELVRGPGAGRSVFATNAIVPSLVSFTFSALPLSFHGDY